MKDDIEIRNLIPDFLTFYNKAIGKQREERWKLWKEHYNFAAVPPGDLGEEIAKQLVNEAWPLVPGKQEEQYIEFTKGWLKSCNSKKKEIMEGLLPFLDDSSSATLTKFTFGTGTTGNERELYFAGWELVKELQKLGVTFNELSHIPEEDIPNYLREIYPS